MSAKRNIHFITKKFAHHSSHSGYDRLLEFVPHTPFLGLPISKLFTRKYKEQKVEECLAKWDHYGVNEIETELEILYSVPFLNKHIFHFIYAENTFCYSGGFNRTNKILVGTYHQPESWFKSSGSLRYPYFTSRISSLDGVIAVSNNQAEFFRQFNSNVFCVHHGIDTEFFTPSQTEAGSDAQICQFVGNWLRDFSTLKEVIRILRTKSPSVRIRVVTPEKNRPLLDGVQAEILSGISDEELRETYRTASVVLLPLQDCTANNSALEAMACGVPSVVTDIGGIRDYLTEECAVFCSPCDAEQMADAVVGICNDATRRNHMGSAARIRAVNCFAWPVIAQKMTEIYQQLL